jgi:hypothetical protein
MTENKRPFELGIYSFVELPPRPRYRKNAQRLFNNFLDSSIKCNFESGQKEIS